MVKKKLLNMFQIFFSELEEKYNELCRINKWCRDCFALVGVLNRFVVLWKFITKHLFLALGITTIIFFFGEFDCPFLGHLNPVNPKLFPRLSEHLRYLHYRRVHWSPLYKKCRLFGFYSISNETSLFMYIIYNYTFILKNLFCYINVCI